MSSRKLAAPTPVLSMNSPTKSLAKIKKEAMPAVALQSSSSLSVMPRSTAATSDSKQSNQAAAPVVHMDDDDIIPVDLIIAEEEKMDTSDEQARISKQKLMDTLSFSFPGGSLANALANIKTDSEPLSQSCFSQIRLDKGPDDFEDDELTSLDWLQDKNLLKNISGNTRLCPSPLSSGDEFSDDDYESGKENDSLNNSFTSHINSPLPHPSHIPYNPHKHVNSKPPYSFSCLIFMAIEDAPDKKLPVKDIYSWILTHFPYFQNAPTGWKNSVRHNLSLNKCFQKVDKDKTSNIGKGSYWCIDPDYRPNLLQALRKTPYHPYHQLQMMSSPIQMGTPHKLQLMNSVGSGGNTISPHLFPFLSRRLNAHNDSLDSDIDVANALVSLKKSPFTKGPSHQPRMRTLNFKDKRSRSPSPPEFGSAEDKSRTTHRSRRATSPIIITDVPSADHTYSANNVPKGLFGSPDSSSIDGEYEFNNDDEEDEEVDDDEALASGDEYDSEEEQEMSMEVDSRKEMEGVNALLNLASIATSVMSDIPETKTTKSTSKSKPKTVSTTSQQTPSTPTTTAAAKTTAVSPAAATSSARGSSATKQSRTSTTSSSVAKSSSSTTSTASSRSGSGTTTVGSYRNLSATSSPSYKGPATRASKRKSP